MLQVNITLTAPELAGAMEALAAALKGAKIENLLPTLTSNTPIPPADYIPPAPVAPNPAPEPLPTPSAVPVTPAASVTPVPPVQQTVEPAPTVPVTQAPTYNRDQIMTAGAALIDAGKINELMKLLNTFGVQAVTQLKQDQLGAFATELRKLGAQI